jgi:hypothetical protein
MTLEQFISNIDTLKKYLVEDFNKDVMLLAGQDMVAGVKGRVQSTGKLTDGTTRKYSTRGFVFKTKDFLQKSAIPKSKGGGVPVEVFLKGGYEEFRRIQGLQTAYKDYNYTGEMWRNTKVLKEKTDSKFVYIGGTTPMAQNKINLNSKRDGQPITMPNPEEIEIQTAFIRDKLIERINTLLNV